MNRAFRSLAPIVISATVVLLSACSQAAPTANPSPSAPASDAPAWSQTASAAENQAAFDAVLQPLQAADRVPDERTVVNSLRQAGARTEQLQVTPSVTPTKLAADTLSVSVRIGQSCLVGQFLPGSFTSAVAAPIDGACLVGRTVPIDW